MYVVSKKKIRTETLLSLEVIPSPAVKRIVLGQVLVYGTRRQPAGPSTGQSTPRGRNLLGPFPILTARFEEAGSTAESLGNAARRPAAGGRLAGSLLLNLETIGDEVITCQRWFQHFKKGHIE